ncbi:MAG TPA: hypothetical protein PL000_08005 [Anaerolineales bacterium]|nr:hypothetical protein [Anaerolineales bacterium]
MSLSEEPIIPTEPTPPSPDPSSLPPRPRRRRATRRDMIPTDAEGQAALISELSRRAYPSIELFVFSLVAGAILGLGFLRDSQAILLLGILITPLMIPWVGFLLASLTGSPRFLFETLMALLISGVIVFIGGLLSGFAARLFLPITLTNVFIHARLWPEELFVLAIGAITLVASFVRSESKPFLPSVIVAYTFYLPINASGFGLGSGVDGIWPEGILVFATHFMLASILGLITLLVLRLRPSNRGLILSGVMLLVFTGTLFSLMGNGFPLTTPQTVSTSTPTPSTQPTAIPSLTPSLPPTTTNTVRPSNTPKPTNTPSVDETLSATPTEETENTATNTSTATKPAATPTKTTSTPAATSTNEPIPTVTMTIEVQTIPGTISADEGGGANLRQTPNGKYLMTLDNNTVVEIYPDFKVVNGITWLHVYVIRNDQQIEGWLLESVVSYATPEPNFEPSSTPEIGITPAP